MTRRSRLQLYNEGSVINPTSNAPLCICEYDDSRYGDIPTIIALMIALITPDRGLERLASNLQQRRLGLGLTQAGLSVRSGVPLGTLKKFERTGQASTAALMKLLIALGAAEATLKASEPETAVFASIDEVLGSPPRGSRKRGWRA